MKEQGDILQVEGINSRGFGTIPKLVMQDKRMSAQAKAIYAYFCSFAGAGATAFPRQTKITADLALGKNSYYKHFNQLKEYGYIRVEQEKDPNGKFMRNLYTLTQSAPFPQNRETATPDPPFPHLRDTDKRDTENRETAIYSNKNNSLKINSSKSNSPSCRTEPPEAADVTDRIEELTEAIREQIGYSDFEQCRPLDMRLLDEIVAIIVDAQITVSIWVRIDGEIKPRELVLHQLRQLDYEAVEHVVGQFKSHTGRIRKKRQYLLTMLYNSRLELDAHYTNEVSTDFGGRI